ncbi:hypothetical protein CKO25_20185 [Thiocapsa imhoffii]|uniref:Transposase IS200-like domain-containing protein n=1 Tax=Thiocapsa imhoffii TaxID=382777 RepID=A0A9X0WMC7_9GAMM|nr:hypothetical protein [Thiocapsa imhoffii]
MFIAKDHRSVPYGQLRTHLGDFFHRLARQKDSRFEEWHLMSDHVYMVISIPSKETVT